MASPASRRPPSSERSCYLFVETACRRPRAHSHLALAVRRRWEASAAPSPTITAAAAAAAGTAAGTAAPQPSTQLRPIQPRPPPLTAEGFVPHTASLGAVPQGLQPLLDAALEACRSQLGSSLLGVYVRGSLVQPDSFLPDISDADFLVLYLADSPSSSSSGGASGASEGEGAAAGAAAADSLRQAARRLQRAFPECAKVGHMPCCSRNLALLALPIGCLRATRLLLDAGLRVCRPPACRWSSRPLQSPLARRCTPGPSSGSWAGRVIRGQCAKSCRRLRSQTTQHWPSS